MHGTQAANWQLLSEVKWLLHEDTRELLPLVGQLKFMLWGVWTCYGMLGVHAVSVTCLWHTCCGMFSCCMSGGRKYWLLLAKSKAKMGETIKVPGGRTIARNQWFVEVQWYLSTSDDQARKSYKLLPEIAHVPVACRSPTSGSRAELGAGGAWAWRRKHSLKCISLGIDEPQLQQCGVDNF